MDDEVCGVRDDRVVTLGLPLIICRGATQALDRGNFSMLIDLTVFAAYEGFQYHKKQVRAMSTGGEPM